jgi:hypothetical protein
LKVELEAVAAFACAKAQVVPASHRHTIGLHKVDVAHTGDGPRHTTDPGRVPSRQKAPRAAVYEAFSSCSVYSAVEGATAVPAPASARPRRQKRERERKRSTSTSRREGLAMDSGR